MHQSNFRPTYIFNNDAYFFRFSRTKIPLIFFNLNSFYRQQALHLGVQNYEKQCKDGTCKVLGRYVVFSAYYADFSLCLKSVIITTLTSLTLAEFGRNDIIIIDVSQVLSEFCRYLPSFACICRVSPVFAELTSIGRVCQNT